MSPRVDILTSTSRSQLNSRWSAVSSACPHFLHDGAPLNTPMQCRCFLRCPCPVTSPVICLTSLLPSRRTSVTTFRDGNWRLSLLTLKRGNSAHLLQCCL